MARLCIIQHFAQRYVCLVLHGDSDHCDGSIFAVTAQANWIFPDNYRILMMIKGKLPLGLFVYCELIWDSSDSPRHWSSLYPQTGMAVWASSHSSLSQAQHQEPASRRSLRSMASSILGLCQGSPKEVFAASCDVDTCHLGTAWALPAHFAKLSE